MTHYHHQEKSGTASALREIVFGIEDGMVSTLGAVTGIAIGTQDHFTVILSGVVIIAVESVSMGIGSYLSNQSEQEVHARLLKEEEEEIAHFPEEEKTEMQQLFMREGWPKDFAQQMSEIASQNKSLMLKEMAYHEHGLNPQPTVSAVANGAKMFFSYIIGGLLPLFTYFFLTVTQAMPISIGITLVGLFLLGAYTTKYTHAPWIRSGVRMLILGGIALSIGLIVGKIAA
ncbi:MAG: VIT1/CCC1 transporter family protein [Patescibacteria group bacterium]|jgi:predicted membrane protein (TIGR00267 family)